MSRRSPFYQCKMRALQLLKGKATETATREVTNKWVGFLPADRRELGSLGLTVTSIGLGTGQFPITNEPQTIRQYAEVVETAVRGGINLIDCASNYSLGTAEVIVGCVLADLVQHHSFNRSGFVLCSKGGYVPNYKADANKNFVDYDHSLEPHTLHQQLCESRNRLQVETIDIYFLHNPEEYLLRNGRLGFEDQMQHAFEYLESAVQAGEIAAYGVASAEGFRLAGPYHHPLESLLDLAVGVGGNRHHFAAIQVPFSLGQPEALLNNNESIHHRKGSILEAAREYDLAVIGSASLNHMFLPPRALRSIAGLCPVLNHPAQVALNFARSTPGIDSALFGTRNPKHVENVLKVLEHPLLDFELVGELFLS